MTHSVTPVYYLKWTNKGRVPSYQGGDPIPARKWTDRVADPQLCVRGWHACRWEDAASHIARELWVCELDGQIVQGVDKVAGERLRLVRQVDLSDRVLREWALDCAEHVLPIFEARFPDDPRPRRAIEAGRGLLAGVTAAAYAADAADAARAARAADAAAAAYAARAADAAARAADAADAARAAHAAAAADAAYAAAERAWQTDRLLAHHLHLNPSDFAHKDNS